MPDSPPEDQPSGEDRNSDSNADSSTAPDSNADSSSADGSKSLVDSIVDAVNKQGESPSSEDNSEEHSDDDAKAADASTVEGGDADKAADGKKADAEASDDLTKEEYDNLKPKTQKSIDRLREKVSTVGAELEEANARLAEQQPLIEEHQRLRGFVDHYGISDNDLNEALDIVRYMYTDRAKALEVLTEKVESLRVATGARLPDDLAEQVKEGQITQAYAQELSQRRAAEAQRKADDERRAVDDDRRRQQALAENKKTFETTLEKCEASWKSSDPDYPKKRRHLELVMLDSMQRLRKNGRLPVGAAETKSFFDECLKETNDHFSQFKPKREPIDPPPGGSSAAASLAKQPDNLTDAIMQGVNGA